MTRRCSRLALRIARFACVAALLALAPPARAGGPAFLVKDINTTTNPYLFTDPSSFTAVGNAIYFAARDERNGSELWKSDATGAGAALVKDITPGPADTYPGSFANVNGTLFFAVGGGQLWKSDGTAAGTLLIKSFDPSISAIYGTGIAQPTVVGGTLLFEAGGQLWKSDGTSAGTLLVKNITLLGSYISYSANLLNMNGTLFFAASDGRSGYELWKSDGTAAGTVRVKDINPGAGDSNPLYLVNVGGTLFFQAYDGHAWALWKSNGTTAGTVRIKNVNFCVTGSDTAVVNGTLFFVAFDPSSGCELWKSDGTAAGTLMVKDLIPGVTDSQPYSLMAVGGTLFFLARDGDNIERLWKSDGTAAGTLLVTLRSQPSDLVNLNGTLFFDGSGGLWKSDGTDAGTVLVKNVPANSLTSLNGMLFFVVTDPSDSARAPWKSDGTPAGTVAIRRSQPGTDGAELAELTEVNGGLFFSAETESAGDELWKSDGSAAGTLMVTDIYSGEADSYPRHLTNVDGMLYFVAGADEVGNLWKSDGTAAGTVQVKEFPPGALDSNFYYDKHTTRLINFGGMLYFIASDQNTGSRKIWKSDGTAAGTVPITATNAAFAGVVTDLVDLNSTLFFATDGQLWRSDGTLAGTTLVKTFDILPPTCWRFYCSYPPPSPAKLTNVGGRLFFSAYDDQTGYELWTSDGTAAGTQLVNDINPGTNNSNPDNLVDVNGKLFFSADDGASGRELWKSDGTAAGTVLVKDIAPGMESSSPSSLANVNGALFFAASDGVSGYELWRSDGTGGGTSLMQDVAPGPSSSNPAGVTLAGDTLFFSADDGNTSQELWAIRAGVDTYIQAPAWVGAAPGGVAAIPVHYGNLGLASATALTLTATLDPALTYLGDTSSITPTVGGQIVTWQLAPGALGKDGFALHVRMPNAAIGTTYPVTLTLTAAGETHPVDNTTRVDVMIARQVFLPAVGR
jgi:ELWxxDGT repeat protein